MNLLEPHAGLSFLEEPFSKEEIGAIIKDLPSNKSPGPNAFNTDFIKKCCPIICKKIYDLCDLFYKGDLCLQSINNYFITLIPKKIGASCVNDYKLISLLSCTIKLLTKQFANRLLSIILELIHINQYTFRKSRTTHDCISWAYEYLFQCHKRRKPTMASKLDFEKAFEKNENGMILTFVRHKGFGDK